METHKVNAFIARISEGGVYASLEPEPQKPKQNINDMPLYKIDKYYKALKQWEDNLIRVENVVFHMERKEDGYWFCEDVRSEIELFQKVEIQLTQEGCRITRILT